MRLYRTGILCEMLVKAGHEVTWWTSTFDHMQKRHRYQATETVRLSERCRVVFLRGLGYRRNVSVGRILDHRVLARVFTERIAAEDRPDVIVCSYPTIELAVASVTYGARKGVPVVLDVRDLWPEIFLELIPKRMRSLVNVGLWPMWRAARRAFAGASAITGNTDQFVQWGLRLARRGAGRLDRHFLFGYPIPDITSEEEATTKAFWSAHGVPTDGSEFVACFLGTVGRQFDLETVVDAALRLRENGEPVKVVICGVGEKLDALRARASGCADVVFPGWVDRKQIWTLMNLADVGMAPYLGGMGFEQSVPNKVVEYLAAGLPIISSLGGAVKELLGTHLCGMTYRCGDTGTLIRILKQLREDRDQCAVMSNQAKRLFESTYSAERVYGAMIDYLCEVSTTGRSAKSENSSAPAIRERIAEDARNTENL